MPVAIDDLVVAIDSPEFTIEGNAVGAILAPPAFLVELDLGGYINGAILDDPVTAQLGSAVLGPTTPTYPQDITPYVREISTHRGAARELERVEAGTASITLDNRNGRFTPFNPASPYYPFILPMRP